MKPEKTILSCLLGVALGSVTTARASIAITNGDFQASAPAANQADVVGWFDDSPSSTAWWEGTWYGPTVSPFAANKSCLGLSYMNDASHWAYQSIGTNSESINTLNLKFDAGSFTDAGGNIRNLGIKVSLYQSDGTFVGADNTDIAGASGVTLIDEFSVATGDLSAGQVVAGLAGSLDLSTANTTGELFLRVSNYAAGTGQPWAAVDNLVIVYAVPTFSTQPVDYTGNVGDTVTLTAVADSDPAPTFKWEKSPDGSTGWTEIPDATSATLEIVSAIPADNGYYRVIATNSNSSAISDVAQISLVYPNPAITQQPASSAALEGGDVTLAVTATGLGNLNYQWYKVDAGGDIALPGETSDSLQLTGLDANDEGSYYVIVSDDAAVAGGGAATETISTTVTVTIADLLVTASPDAPTADSSDQFYLPGNVDDINNINGSPGGVPITESGMNDASTYVAFDKTSQGMTFTTGTNAAGYSINSITVQHVLWINFLGNGTWCNIQNGDSFELQVGTISGTTKTPLFTTTKAFFSGSAIVGNGTSGTGSYLTFDLSAAGIGTLAPNTTYYFEIAPQTGDAYFELNGTSLDGYAGGTAFRGDTNATIDATYVELPGDRAFHVDLTGLSGPANDYTSWIAGYPGVGAFTGFKDDADGDGIDNGVENLCGTNPSVSNQGIVQVARSGSTVTFQHPQNATPASDVSASYVWSTDLVTFIADGASAGGTTVSFVASPDTPTAGITTVTATITGTAPAKLFVSLKATQGTP